MCEPLTTLRLESLDIKGTDSVRPVIDAAFSAADSTCCAMRKNAVSRAVFETARELGFRVAWGDVLNDEAPDFYIWPADSWKRETIRRHLEDHRASEIRARDLGTVAA